MHETFCYDTMESELFIFHVKFEQKLSQVVISEIVGPSEEIVHCTNVFYKKNI